MEKIHRLHIKTNHNDALGKVLQQQIQPTTDESLFSFHIDGEQITTEPPKIGKFGYQDMQQWISDRIQINVNGKVCSYERIFETYRMMIGLPPRLPLDIALKQRQIQNEGEQNVKAKGFQRKHEIAKQLLASFDHFLATCEEHHDLVKPHQEAMAQIVTSFNKVATHLEALSLFEIQIHSEHFNKHFRKFFNFYLDCLDADSKLPLSLKEKLVPFLQPEISMDEFFEIAGGD